MIWINFADLEDVPWIAGPDFLLSRLCRPVGGGLYQVDPNAREVMLVDMVDQDPDGPRRLRQLADFLLGYVERQSWLTWRPGVLRAYQWIAWSYLDPERVVSDMTRVLQASEAAAGRIASLATASDQRQVAVMLDLVRAPLEFSLTAEKYQDLAATADFLVTYWYPTLPTAPTPQQPGTRPNPLLEKVVDNLHREETVLTGTEYPATAWRVEDPAVHENLQAEVADLAAAPVDSLEQALAEALAEPDPARKLHRLDDLAVTPLEKFNGSPAEIAARESGQLTAALYGKESREHAARLETLAKRLANFDEDPAEALKIYDQVSAIVEKVYPLGFLDPEAGRILEARLYLMTTPPLGPYKLSEDDYGEAEEIGQRALRILEVVPADIRPAGFYFRQLGIYQGLIRLWRSRGDEIPKAIEATRSMLDLLVKVSPPPTGDLAEAYEILGELQMETNPTQAQAALKQAIQTWLMAGEKPVGGRVTHLRLTLSHAMRLEGDPAAAVQLLQETSLDIEKAGMTESDPNPNYLLVRSELASVFLDLQDWTNARQTLEDLWQLRHKLGQEDTPEMAQDYYNLALANQGLQNWQLALAALEQAEKAYQTSYTPEDPFLVTAKVRLSDLRGRLEKAVATVHSTDQTILTPVSDWANITAVIQKGQYAEAFDALLQMQNLNSNMGSAAQDILDHLKKVAVNRMMELVDKLAIIILLPANQVANLKNYIGTEINAIRVYSCSEAFRRVLGTLQSELLESEPRWALNWIQSQAENLTQYGKDYVLNLAEKDIFRTLNDLGFGENSVQRLRKEFSQIVGSFVPSIHGWKFVNAFAGYPLPFKLPTLPGLSNPGSIYGMCGGMVFGALDLFLDNRPPPSDVNVPANGTPIQRFIFNRQMDSMGTLGETILRFSNWMELPDETPHGTLKLTLDEFDVKIRPRLDKSLPTPIGLLYVKKRDSHDVWLNHQALAVRYVLDSFAKFRIYIYDPNYPIRDDIYIEAENVNVEGIDGLRLIQRIGTNESKKLYGFFSTPYRPMIPPANISNKIK